MASKPKFATTIRMGAAHNEIKVTRNGKREASVALPHPDVPHPYALGRQVYAFRRAIADLGSVAAKVCEYHGIREPQKRGPGGRFLPRSEARA